ncbi:MAG TPA: hypothetical protein VN285_01570, partial [Candidatus Deferrimicrobium sp.]|nr:hypothetical protein [Candidatus Deferrimicrobium sp.]
RRCVTFDIDPIFAEISIRRLEHFRQSGRTGWQAGNPFEKELQLSPIRMRPAIHSGHRQHHSRNLAS